MDLCNRWAPWGVEAVLPIEVLQLLPPTVVVRGHHNMEVCSTAPLSAWVLVEVAYGSPLFYLANYFHVAFRNAGNFEIFISFSFSGQGVQQLFKGKRHRCAHMGTGTAFKTGLSYRQQRNFFGILSLVVSLDVSLSDFHWKMIETGPECATSLIIWDNENKGDCKWLNASCNTYIKTLSWCQRSTQMLCDKSSWCTLQLLNLAMYSPMLLLLK